MKEKIEELYIQSVYDDVAPNVFADMIVEIFKNIDSLPNDDDAVNYAYRKVFQGQFATRNVFKNSEDDHYYSGFLDGLKWLRSELVSEQENTKVKKLLHPAITHLSGKLSEEGIEIINKIVDQALKK